VTTAFLAIAAGLVAYTSLEFILEAVQAEFAMTSDETIVLAQIPAGACLVAVFLTGALADRLGDRRILVGACAILGVGAVIAGVAPQPAVLVAGLSIGGVGTIAMSIVGLSVLDKTFTDPTRRARAFGAFAVIAPLVAIVVPLVSSGVVTRLGWRWVATVWVAVAVSTALLTRRTLRRGPGPGGRPELVTPALAGVALAGIALSFLFLKANASTGGATTAVVASAVVGVGALVVLVAVMWRRHRPTLDLRSLRVRGAFPIMASVFLVNAVNLFLFTYLLLQYRYHQTLLETAVFLIPPQLTAMVGALLGGRLSARLGNERVAVVSLGLAALLSLTTLAVTAGSSPWLAVATVTLAALPMAASVGSLTHAVMDLAPVDGQGATSAVRNAAVNLGIAIGGAVVGTLVFDELDADTARTAAAYARQADAFHLAGLLCFASYLAAAVLVVAYVRRRRQIPSRTIRAAAGVPS